MMDTRSLVVRFPPLKPSIKYFLLVQLGVFLVQILLNLLGVSIHLGTLLSLSWNTLLQGHLFQFVTYLFVPQGLMELLFNGLFFWFLGGELIDLWGEKAFWYFIGAIVFGAGIFHILLSGILGVGMISLSGMGVVATALMFAYAVFFPDRYFAFLLIFPVPARYLMLITVGMELFVGITTPYALEAWTKLWSMCLSCVLLMAFFRVRQFPWRIFNFGWMKGGPSSRKNRSQKKGHLSLVKNGGVGEEEQGPPGGPPKRPPKYWN